MTIPQRYLLLFALALAARFALIGTVLGTHTDGELRTLFADTRSYTGPAASLLHLGSLREAPVATALPMHVRTPGYPLFLAAHYAVFGLSQAPVLITQGLLGAAVALVVYTLARRWLAHERLALLVGVAASVAPASVAASGMSVSDLVSYALFASGLLAFAEGIARQRTWPVVGAGALWGASCLVHPRLLLFPVAALVLGWLLARRVGRRVPWAALVASVAAFALFPLGWAARNAHQLGFLNVSVTGNYNLKHHLAVDMCTRSDWRQSKPLRAQWLAAERAQMAAGVSVAEMNRQRFRDAWQVIAAQPLLAVRTYVYSALQYLCSTGTDMVTLLPLRPWPRARRVFQMSMAWMARVGVLVAVPGVVCLWRTDRWLAAALLVMAGYFVGIAAIGSRQSGRMIVQAEPAYLILFVAGLQATATRLMHTLGRRRAPAGARGAA